MNEAHKSVENNSQHHPNSTQNTTLNKQGKQGKHSVSQGVDILNSSVVPNSSSYTSKSVAINASGMEKLNPELEKSEQVAEDSSENEIGRLKEELLRLHADMENTKKRLTRLFEDRVRDKTVAILLDVIEHIDNFERAFESQQQMKKEQSSDLGAVFDGFGMIKTQLMNTLQNNWGLNTIDSVDRQFNPDEHEAIMQENSLKVKEPTVVQEFSKGYTYLGKVIRPAKVRVALPGKSQ